MTTQTIVTPRHTLDELLKRIEEQQRKVARLCTCGRLGKVYADDGRTLLCCDCWWKIYGES